MTSALLVLLYAIVLAWLMPTILSRLTADGMNARLGLAGWLVAMASAVASAGVALTVLIRATVDGWSRFAEAFCRTVAGGACTTVVYRSFLYEIGVGLAAIAATLTSVVLAWRYGRRLQRAQRITRAHAEAARITGQIVPREPGHSRQSRALVVLDAPEPAAYCVPGRPDTVVVTSGALGILDAPQLDAVLAHERAHLSGRHHLLVALTRGLATTFPAVPLFSRGSAEVARLTEMRADDAAAHTAGRRPLIEALLAMGTGTAVPAPDQSSLEMPAAESPSAESPSAESPSAGSPATVVSPAGRPPAGFPSSGVPTAGVPTAGVPTAGVPTAGVPTGGVPTGGFPGSGVPTAALAAASYAVAARVQRLLEPPHAGRRARRALALSGVIGTLTLLSAIVFFLATA